MPTTKIELSWLASSGGDFQLDRVDLDQIAARAAVVV